MLEKYRVQRGAEKLVLSGKYERAIREYEKLVRREGEDPSVLNTLGDLLLKVGRRDEALKNFQRVADIYTTSGFSARAIAICKKIHEINPTDGETNATLIDLFLKAGLEFEARRHLKKQVERCREWGHTEEALRLQKKVVELDSDSPAGHRELALLYLQDSRPEEASLHFKNAAELFTNQGQGERATECLHEAQRVLQRGVAESTEVTASQRALEGEPEEPGYGEIRLDEEPVQPEAGPAEREDVETERLSTEPGLERRPESQRFDVLQRGGDTTDRPAEEAGQEGVALFEAGDEADEEIPDEPWEGSLEEAVQEADFYLKLGLHDDAERLLKILMREFPADERVLRRAEKAGLPVPEFAQSPPATMEAELAGSEQFDAEIDSAFDGLFSATVAPADDEILRYDVTSDGSRDSKEDPKVHYDLGLAYREMGLVQDAIEKFTEAYKLFDSRENAPQKVLCCSMLSTAFLQMDQYEEAAKWADRGLDLPDKKDFEWKALQYDACLAAERMGDSDKALEGYRILLERDPQYRDVPGRIDSLLGKAAQ